MPEVRIVDESLANGGMNLSAAIYARRGHLIVAHHQEYPMGKPFPASGSLSNRIPLRIIGTATRAQWVAQCKLARELSGKAISEQPWKDYFYFVEVVD